MRGQSAAQPLLRGEPVAAGSTGVPPLLPIGQDNGISVPKHIVVSRTPEQVENGEDPEGFEESEDYIVMNGFQINKPFVEKPVSGEDHNVYIYYPHSMVWASRAPPALVFPDLPFGARGYRDAQGGGVKRLFRKVDDKSADYDSSHPGNVRRDGSYIYEVFLATGGTDVKVEPPSSLCLRRWGGVSDVAWLQVYTVGPRYAHAEARKSPVVDGRVQRAADGKEVTRIFALLPLVQHSLFLMLSIPQVRFPVLLSPHEKEIARLVSLAFGQKVSGIGCFWLKLCRGKESDSSSAML